MSWGFDFFGRPQNNDHLLIVLTYGGDENRITSGPTSYGPDEEQVYVKLENGRIAWRNMDGSLVNTGWVKQNMRHPEVKEAIEEALSRIEGRPVRLPEQPHFMSTASTRQIEEMEGRKIYGTKQHPWKTNQWRRR